VSAREQAVLEQLSTDESEQIKLVGRIMQSPLATDAMALFSMIRGGARRRRVARVSRPKVSRSREAKVSLGPLLARSD
jgi:hypothetical protein